MNSFVQGSWNLMVAFGPSWRNISYVHLPGRRKINGGGGEDMKQKMEMCSIPGYRDAFTDMDIFFVFGISCVL